MLEIGKFGQRHHWAISNLNKHGQIYIYVCQGHAVISKHSDKYLIPITEFDYAIGLNCHSQLHRKKTKCEGLELAVVKGWQSVCSILFVK